MCRFVLNTTILLVNVEVSRSANVSSLRLSSLIYGYATPTYLIETRMDIIKSGLMVHVCELRPNWIRRRRSGRADASWQRSHFAQTGGRSARRTTNPIMSPNITLKGRQERLTDATAAIMHPVGRPTADTLQLFPSRKSSSGGCKHSANLHPTAGSTTVNHFSFYKVY